MASADTLRAGIYGVLVGDALGVPYEFLEPEQIGEVAWRGGGAHGQPPGTWSDDGALTLALLDSLCSVGFSTADQAQRAVAGGPPMRPALPFAPSAAISSPSDRRRWGGCRGARGNPAIVITPGRRDIHA
jgi:hypothetical protein